MSLRRLAIGAYGEAMWASVVRAYVSHHFAPVVIRFVIISQGLVKLFYNIIYAIFYIPF